MPCEKCKNNGVIKNGSSELPCKCIVGMMTKFTVEGVEGLVFGAEVLNYFARNAPERIRLDGKIVKASSLPSRKNWKKSQAP